MDNDFDLRKQEIESWQKLAKACDRPVQYDSRPGWWVIEMDSELGYGLCPLIRGMQRSDAVRDSMLAKIVAMPRLQFGRVPNFCWPPTKEGHMARAAWCREQARLLEEKKEG